MALMALWSKIQLPVLRLRVAQRWATGAFRLVAFPKWHMISQWPVFFSSRKSIKRWTGWWLGTFFIFPYIGNDHPNWLVFFRGVQTTNQWINMDISIEIIEKMNSMAYDLFFLASSPEKNNHDAKKRWHFPKLDTARRSFPMIPPIPGEISGISWHLMAGAWD